MNAKLYKFLFTSIGLSKGIKKSEQTSYLTARSSVVTYREREDSINIADIDKWMHIREAQVLHLLQFQSVELLHVGNKQTQLCDKEIKKDQSIQ